MNGIALNSLLDLCGYNIPIIIKRADNGKVVISDAKALRRSKDKRQKLKWDVFKDKEVYDIRPSLRREEIMRGDTFFRMAIETWMSKYECEKAEEEYKQAIKDNETRNGNKIMQNGK